MKKERKNKVEEKTETREKEKKYDEAKLKAGRNLRKNERRELR